MPGEELILIYEPERACLDRLLSDGFAPDRATEIASYLSQSTDIVREADEIARACAAYDIVYRPVELDRAASVLDKAAADKALIWTLTDGIAYFRGGAAPALARLDGLKVLGCDDTIFALCQDKFRSGAVLKALGMPIPTAGLARNGTWLVEPPASSKGWFVKPNRLGGKIGVWPDSHCGDLAHAIDLSRRIHSDYRDDAIVQPYVSGRNVRSSFLAVNASAGAEILGSFLVDTGGDFQTMAENIALYGEAGQIARSQGTYVEPVMTPLSDEQPEAAAEIRRLTARLMSHLPLRDIFSVDWRVEDDGKVHLIEFEVCPGLPCIDFRAYLRAQWSMSLGEAMAATAANRFQGLRNR